MASKDLTIRLLGDLSDLQKKLTQASNDLSKVGATMTRKVTPAAAATAVALTKLGNDWNDASDAIVVGTGASGAALDSLLSSAKRVAGQVPNDFSQVGQAIADVNTRLGLTGPELEDTAKAFLDLSRITGTDVTTNIGNVTRVFGDWSVAAEDQSAALDMLFAATQQTGIGIDRLSTLVVQFGAPMRQLGFSMEESIAVFGKFEKEGVNIEAVMSGLRMGLGRMAKAGEEPIETFQRLIEEIKNAGSQGEANALALEGFGQRAGPDMAAAIREGRFEIDDLVAALGDTEGALDDAANRTLHLDDRLKMLRNRLTAAVGPFGEVGGAIAGVAAAAGPLLFGLGQMGPALGKLVGKLGGVRGALKLTAGALGVASAALAIYAINASRAAAEQDRFQDALASTAGMTDEAAAATFKGITVLADATGDLDKTITEFATNNIEAARRLLETGGAAEAGAEAEDKLREALEKADAARIQTNKTLDEYGNVIEESTDATDEATDATTYLADAQGELRDITRLGEDATRRKADADREAKDAADRYRDSIRHVKDEISALKREVDDRQAWLNLQDTFDDTVAKSQDVELSAREQEQAMLDLKGEVLDYAEAINLPDSVVTAIIADIDEGKLGEAQAMLDRLGNGITVPLTLQVVNSVNDALRARGVTARVTTDGNLRTASGTSHSPGGPTWVGERGPELVDMPRGARVRSAVESITDSRGGSGGGPTFQTVIQGNVYGVDHLNRIMDERDRRLANQLRQGRRA